jgi:activator of 2-hydroxyglutaryl-CoA dehydratase
MKLKGEVDIKNKKDKKMLEALYYYHKALIEYTIKKIIKEFKDKVDIELDDPIPIVVSGGTSLPEGFVSLFEQTIMKSELPFEVSEVRRAKNPLTAVANGLLIRTIADVKGMGK